ncbi:hypothetical protein BDV98DRAFT_557394 [Pterulicium gracile]|uniref:Uncharacterized protein n=1 Tax=Pterulicium gracile TaxID=1884261 RepID=A0A5C3R0Q5_9AGAR|nr:hypothetical protein BDV98DRAFT_557394 [Pterula gracilis]
MGAQTHNSFNAIEMREKSSSPIQQVSAETWAPSKKIARSAIIALFLLALLLAAVAHATRRPS